MSWWDSYRAVYGAELRAAAREYADHGWSLVPGPGADVLLATGDVLDVIEVPAEVGRQVCRTLRGSGEVVPVAATPQGTWWFPMTPRHALPAELSLHADVVLHTDGIGVLAPPTERPDGWVQWRVSPARTGYHIPDAAMLVEAVSDAVRLRSAERSAGGTSIDAERSAGGTSIGAERSAGGTSIDAERSAGGTSIDTRRGPIPDAQRSGQEVAGGRR